MNIKFDFMGFIFKFNYFRPQTHIKHEECGEGFHTN